MGRRNIMKLSSASPMVSGYADLVDKIQKFLKAEEDFYKSRKNALKNYPGFGGKTADQIEKEYDKQYGSDPWNYSSRAGTSSDERTETDATTDSNGADADRFYVQIPDDDGDPIDGITTDASAYGGGHYLLYNPGVGNIDVDVTYENISFSREAESKEPSVQALEVQARITTRDLVKSLFHNANNNYSGKQPHMFKKLGLLTTQL